MAMRSFFNACNVCNLIFHEIIDKNENCFIWREICSLKITMADLIKRGLFGT